MLLLIGPCTWSMISLGIVGIQHIVESRMFSLLHQSYFLFLFTYLFFFSPNFRETLAKGAVASDRLVLCNGSSTGSSDCEIMKESPATFSRTFHFPHTYVVFLCVSLGSALLVSSAFIMSYYFFNVRKRTDKAEEDDGPSGDWSYTKTSVTLSFLVVSYYSWRSFSQNLNAAIEISPKYRFLNFL